MEKAGELLVSVFRTHNHKLQRDTIETLRESFSPSDIDSLIIPMITYHLVGDPKMSDCQAEMNILIDNISDVPDDDVLDQIKKSLHMYYINGKIDLDSLSLYKLGLNPDDILFWSDEK